MGVITYISLCGNFPFEEDANFDPDALEDPAFLFGGDDIWDNVSNDGRNLAIIHFFS